MQNMAPEQIERLFGPVLHNTPVEYRFHDGRWETHDPMQMYGWVTSDTLKGKGPELTREEILAAREAVGFVGYRARSVVIVRDGVGEPIRVSNMIPGLVRDSGAIAQEMAKDAGVEPVPQRTTRPITPNANVDAVYFLDELEPSERKQYPIATGVLDYFPDALAVIARVSKLGNDQHSPGQPMHWARAKSNDQADTILRHLSSRGTLDTDGVPHSAKMAWRALALLQTEIEANYRAAEAAGVKYAPGLQK
jgi:hypothetical protein